MLEEFIVECGKFFYRTVTMRTISNKKKKEIQKNRFSGMPRKMRYDPYKRNSMVFPSQIIETVNLIDDSDEENTHENIVSSLHVPSVSGDIPDQNAEVKSYRKSSRYALRIRKMNQSVVNLTDTTLSDSMCNFQDKELQKCETNTSTPENQLEESSQSTNNEHINDCEPLNEIDTHEINKVIDNEEPSMTDYSPSSSSTSSGNYCTVDDNDIIFVSQTQNHKNNQENVVIVIDDDGDIKGFKTPKKPKRKPKKKLKAILQCKSKQNNHNVRKFNTCNNTSGSNVLRRVGLREIVIDGSNVAFGHSKGAYFSVRGLYIAIQYFLEKGHKVTAFVPQFRLKIGESSSPAFLQELADKRYVVFTPSREVLGERITPYDDRIIIQYAHMREAIVVSNDNYRDLLLEKPEWKNTIKDRLLMYTWIDDLLIFAEDPLGRRGPPLSDFLKFP